MAWAFLLDENVDPKTARYLEKEGVQVEHVRDALEQGATDTEVISHAEQHDQVIVTSDVTDFSSVSVDVVLLYDDTMPAYDVAAGLLSLIGTYPSRDAVRGQEILDDWV